MLCRAKRTGSEKHWLKHNRSYKNDEIDVAELPISGITLEST